MTEPLPPSKRDELVLQLQSEVMETLRKASMVVISVNLTYDNPFGAVAPYHRLCVDFREADAPEVQS